MNSPQLFFRRYTWRTLIGLAAMPLILSMLTAPYAYTQDDAYEVKMAHPRLVMGQYEEMALRFTALENELAAQLLAELRHDADELLKAKDIKPSLDRRNTMLDISRAYFGRIVTLSLAYRMFEEDKYSEKAIADMMHVCTKYSDWNPQHFLDVAEMTAAVAIGYDWNFYNLDYRARETIRNAIVEKGLNPGIAVYEQPDGKPHVWTTMNNNWNQVCSAGLVLGGLAVADDFPNLTEKILKYAVSGLQPVLKLYQPDGVWYEGPAYWGYANLYLSMMLSSMTASLEHDFDVSKSPGLEKTAAFYVNAVSPAGKIFNFADAASAEESLNPALFYFSKRYANPAVAQYYQNLLKENVNPGSAVYRKGRGYAFFLCLPWFDEHTQAKAHTNARLFKGLTDLVFLRGSAENREAIYLAVKGGQGMLNHQQLDAGTFVFDADGERWALDLGSEHYHLPGFWDKGPGGERWNYYRNTNKSHNTLVIGDHIQDPAGVAHVVHFNDADEAPFGILDLGPVYPETKAARRGVRLLNENAVLLRDEVMFDTSPLPVRWGFITDAQFSIDGHELTLHKGGKKIYVRVLADEPIQMKVEPAKAWHKEAKSNDGHYLIYFVANEDSRRRLVKFSVLMGRSFSGLDPSLAVQDLDAW
jgi:hypothetical protein